MKEVLNNIIKKQKNKLPERKMFVYSGHDISLINILHPMKLFKNLKPEYGAAFIIEAHSAKTDDYEIKVIEKLNPLNILLKKIIFFRCCIIQVMHRKIQRL